MADDRCDLLCLDLEVAEKLRRERLGVGRAEELAGEAKALGDPTRLTQVLDNLLLNAVQALCVCDVAWVMEWADNLVSHLLRVLRSEGLVASRREGKMVMYSLTDRGRELARTMIGMESRV